MLVEIVYVLSSCPEYDCKFFLKHLQKQLSVNKKKQGIICREEPSELVTKVHIARSFPGRRPTPGRTRRA